MNTQPATLHRRTSNTATRPRKSSSGATRRRKSSSGTTLNVASVYEWPFNSDVLTLVQAAALLKCHPKTLRIMAKNGKVPAKRVGSLWRFYRPALEAWLMEREAAA